MPPGYRLFLAPLIIDTTPWVKKVVSGRFTTSGKPDLAILCWETGGRCRIDMEDYNKGFMVRPFINITNPGDLGATFSPGPKIKNTDNEDRTFDMYPSDIAIGDINRDGLDDIVVAHCHSDHIFIYISRGDGTFNAPIKIEHTGADDPCYVTVGNFSGSGKPDLAVLHTSRCHPEPGKNLAWTFSFLFGNGDGTFQDPITQDLGKWSVPDAEDGGMYYHSGHFNFFTMKGSVNISGVYRDAVAMGTVMRWWDGTNIAGPDHPADHFKTSLGQHSMGVYGPRHADLAVFGGRVTKTSAITPADLPITNVGSTGNLDRSWLGYTGFGITNECSGIHVIAEDFDNDGIVDILLFNDVIQKRGGEYIAPDQEFFLAYGKDPAINPLHLDFPSPEIERLKYFEGPAGGWGRGHRPWRTVVADFDLDGFPDIVHSTFAGLVLFTNVGVRIAQAAQPQIQQFYVEQPHTPPDPWYGDRLVIQFQIFDDRKVMAAHFRSVTDPNKAYLIFMDERSINRGTLSIPDEELLPVDSYELRVFNGVVLSYNFLDVKVILRPIEVRSVKLLKVKKKEDHDSVEMEGFFGTDKDRRKTNFELQKKTTPPPPPIFLASGKTDENKAVQSVSLSTPPGLYDLIVRHPTRGGVVRPLNIPDYSPHIYFVHWNNSDGTWGEYDETKTPKVKGGPIKSGARVEVQGTMLYAPDTNYWELVDNMGTVYVSGSGFTTDLAFGINSNEKGAFLFFPGGLSDSGKDLQLRLKTTKDLQSNLVGPFRTDKLISNPNDPVWYIGVEYLDAGKVGYCNYPSFHAKEYSQTDPMKQPGALQQAKFMFPGNYNFTKLDPGEETIGLCYARHWEITAKGADGEEFSIEEDAISETRARVNFKDVYPTSTIITIKKKTGSP